MTHGSWIMTVHYKIKEKASLFLYHIFHPNCALDLGYMIFTHTVFAAKVVLPTGPDATGSTHWGQQVFFLQPAIKCAPGDWITCDLEIKRQKENYRLMTVDVKYTVGGSSSFATNAQQHVSHFSIAWGPKDISLHAPSGMWVAMFLHNIWKLVGHPLVCNLITVILIMPTSAKQHELGMAPDCVPRNRLSCILTISWT